MFSEITFHSAVCYPSCRSSYSCCYFVLPCCFFDFHGKYSRRQSKKTQYREYLDFVAEVGSVCGFHVEEDCLRIPSTKRVILYRAFVFLFLKLLAVWSIWVFCSLLLFVRYYCCKIRLQSAALLETICSEERLKILIVFLGILLLTS